MHLQAITSLSTNNKLHQNHWTGSVSSAYLHKTNVLPKICKLLPLIIIVTYGNDLLRINESSKY